MHQKWVDQHGSASDNGPRREVAAMHVSLRRVAGVGLWVVCALALRAGPGESVTQAPGQGKIKELYRRQVDGGIVCYAFSPDSKLLAYIEDDYDGLVVLDLATGKEISRMFLGRYRPSDMVFSPDGKLLVTSASLTRRNRSMTVWDVRQGKRARILEIPPRHYYCHPLAFSPDGKYLVGVSGATNVTGVLVLWEMTTTNYFSCDAFLDRSRQVPLDFAPGVIGPVTQARGVAFAADGSPFLIAEHTAPSQKHHGKTAVQAWEIRDGKLHPRNWVPTGFFRIGDDTLLSSWWEQEAPLPNLNSTLGRYRFHISSTKHLVVLPRYQPAPVTVVPHAHGVATLVATPSGTRLGLVPYPGSPEKELHRFEELRSTAANANARSFRLTPDGSKVIAVAINSNAKRAYPVSKIVVWDVTGLHATAEQFRKTPTLKELANLWLAEKSPPSIPGKPLAAFWEELGNEDYRRAHQVMGSLVAHPQEGVAFLKSKMTPLKGAKPIPQLIQDLDSAKFKVRARAAEELQKLGWTALPALRKALAGPGSLEVHLRVEELLKGTENKLSRDELRWLRVIDVLEYVPAAAARDLLGEVARGVYGDAPAASAQTALQRSARP
jgi:hypothetical protein